MARSSFVATLLFVCALAASAQTSSLRLPASACKNGTATAATAAIAGATYDWSVDGGSIIAGAGTERITIRFSGAANARVAVTITSGGASSTSAGTIPLRDPLAIHDLTANATALLAPVTIVWSYDAGAEPATQTLTGTDFPQPIAIPRGTHSYTYTPPAAGAKQVVLRAIDGTSTAPTPVIPGRRRAAASSDITVSECNVATSSAHYSVGECPISNPTIATPDAVAPGANFVASVEADPGSRVEWTITNATPAQAIGMSVNLVAGNSGDVGISVKVISTGACVATAHNSIRIDPAVCDQPTASVTGKVDCGTGEVRVAFTGTAPFIGKWSDGTPFETTSMSLARLVTEPGTYSIASFHDHTCNGTVKGAASFPTMSGSVKLEMKNGSCGNSTIVAKFSGTPPFIGHWWDNGEAFITSETTLERKLTHRGRYVILEFRDATCTDPNHDTHSNEIVIDDDGPTAAVRLEQGSCISQRSPKGATIAADIYASHGPYTAIWSDGLKQTSDSTPIRREERPSANTTYTLVSAMAGDCTADIVGGQASASVQFSFEPVVQPVNWITCAGQYAAADLETLPPPTATITWSVTNGTITSGQGTPHVVYQVGDSGATNVVTCTLTYPDSCPMANTATLFHSYPVIADPALVDVPATMKAGTTAAFKVTVDPNIQSFVVTGAIKDDWVLAKPETANQWDLEYHSSSGPGTVTLGIYYFDKCDIKHSVAQTATIKIE